MRTELPGRALALLLLALLAGCAAPRALSTKDDRAYEVSLARIGDGFAVSWHGGRLSRDALFIRYTDIEGRPAGPAQQLTDASRSAFEPSLQELAGEPVIAWYEQDGERRQVALLARFDAQGRQRWQRQLSVAQANGRNPVIRVAGDIIHAAWIEQQGEAAPVLRVATLDTNGQWLGAPRDAAALSRTTWNLNAALAADGSFHVVYDAAPGTPASELLTTRIRGDSVDTRPLGPSDGRDSVYPDIALDRGHAALTWFDYRDGNAEVYLRCTSLDEAGALRSAPDHRVTDSPGESIGAYLTWHLGRIYLAWSDAGAASQRLLLQVFDDQCRPQGAPRVLSTRAGVAGIPAIISWERGIALTWNERLGTLDDLRRHGHSREPSSIALLRVWPETGNGKR